MTNSVPVFILVLLCGTSGVKADQRETPEERVCPNVLRCQCDFQTNLLACSNVTSVPADIPTWIISVILVDGESIALTDAGRLPRHVYTFAVNRYKKVKIRGEFFQADSNLVEFSLRGVASVSLAKNTFMNTRRVTRIDIKNSNVKGLKKDTFKGLKPRLLFFRGVKLSEDSITNIICSFNTSGLKYFQLDAVGLCNIPKLIAECLQDSKLVSLTLNKNNFTGTSSLKSLAVLKHIRELSVSGSNISEAATLEFLRGWNLTKLDISNNELRAAEVKKIICYLEPKTIKNIVASRNQIGYIDDNFFQCLANAGLTSLILRYGNITSVSKNALRYFNGSLNLDLSNNLIPVEDLSFVIGPRYVQSLHLSQNELRSFPDFRVNGSCLDVKKLTTLHLVGNLIRMVTVDDVQCLGNLQTLTLTGNNIISVPDFTFSKMVRLRLLSLGKNNMESLGRNSLPSRLSVLDLVENNFNYWGLIPIGQLDNLLKLTITGTNDLWSTLFDNKTRLNSLTIADGRVAMGNLRGILKKVINVRHLFLTNLNLHEIPEEILSLKVLKSLFLTNNKIATIPPYFIPKLNTLRHLGVSFNFLECNCSLLPFSLWLRNASRPTKLNDPAHTVCFSPAKLKNTPLFNFDKDCRNLLIIILPSVVVPILLFIIVIITVSVQYRGYIRYGCMLVRARWKGYSAVEGRSFKYDTFVSYNREDAAWVLRVLRPKLEDEAGYQICLHDRDFTVGEDIVDNIITSIDESRKTILVLSDNFAQSQWCQLEMSLAQHKLFEDNRDVLILVRLGEVAEENVTKTMRMLMRTKTYITWPEDAGGLDLFWKNLIFALRRPPGVVMEDPEWPARDNLVQNAENV